MGDAKILKIVAEIFEQRAFEVNLVPTGDAKTPDLLIKKDGLPYFYCEVKNPILQKDEESGLYKHTTTNSKLREFISKAHKQLKAHDIDHSLPWAVVFVSSHFQLNWNNLGNCIKGFVGNQPPIVTDLRDTHVVKRTNDDIRALDFMIWLQLNHDTNIYQSTIFINQLSNKVSEAIKISDTLMPISNRHNQKFFYR